MRRAVVFLALLAGCTFRSGVQPVDAEQSDVTTGGGGGSDGGEGSGGGSGSGSGSGGGGETCSVTGQRVCVDETHSGACDGSLQPVTDRTCPTGSTCSNGYCQPPPGSSACARASDCNGGQVCDLYVVLATLQGFCTDPVGGAGTYASCNTLGDNAFCKSGICAEDSEGTRQCLTPCVNGTDSTCPGDKDCNLLAQPTTIEGVPTGFNYACFD